MDETPHEVQETEAQDPGTGAAGPAGESDPRSQQVLDALENVLDPELGVNIVDLGLVYDVSFEGDTVHVEYTLTTMGCPIGPLIEAQMKQAIQQIEGIEQFEAEMVFQPPWSPDKMSEEAKAALGVI